MLVKEEPYHWIYFHKNICLLLRNSNWCWSIIHVVCGNLLKKKKKPTVWHMFFVRSRRVVYIKNKTIPFNNSTYKTTTVNEIKPFCV